MTSVEMRRDPGGKGKHAVVVVTQGTVGGGRKGPPDGVGVRLRVEGREPLGVKEDARAQVVQRSAVDDDAGVDEPPCRRQRLRARRARGRHHPARAARNIERCLRPGSLAVVLCDERALSDGAEVLRALKVATAADAPERFVNVTAVRLPQNAGAISCVLTRAMSRGPVGVQTRESFEARATNLLAQADRKSVV